MASRLGQIRKNVHLIESVGMDFPEEIIGAQESDICVAFMLFPTVGTQECYKILGVTPNMPFEQIKSVYKRLLVEFHPPRREPENQRCRADLRLKAKRSARLL